MKNIYFRKSVTSISLTSSAFTKNDLMMAKKNCKQTYLTVAIRGRAQEDFKTTDYHTVRIKENRTRAKLPKLDCSEAPERGLRQKAQLKVLVCQ